MDRQKAADFLQSLSRCTSTRRTLTLQERDLRMYCTAVRSLLPDSEYKVLLKRHVETRTFEQIGKDLNVTRQRAQQIEQRGIERLKGITKNNPHKLPELSLEDDE